MGWWPRIWEERAQDWVCGWLDETQSPGGAPNGEIQPETAYLNILLKSARVVNIRQGLTKFYGAVHSFMRVPHRSQPFVAEFNVVTTPAALKNIDAQGIDRVIQLDQRLLGPVPYVGGDLEMQVGLFSIASSDLAAPYLDLLENLSKSAGVSFLSSALPFAAPILEGVRLLAGGNKGSILEIGLSMTQVRPRQGLYVAMRAPKDQLRLRELTLDPSDFRLLDRQGSAVADYPYMVLEIRAEAQRSDWFKIPDLANSYSRVQELYRDGAKSTDAAVEEFRRIARTCNDLTLPDANGVADKVAGMYKTLDSARQEVHRGHGTATQINELPELKEVGLYTR